MGFHEPWLQQDANEVIQEIMDATSQHNPRLEGITLERLQAEGSIPLAISTSEEVPFADGIFFTPSGKVEFYSEIAAARGYDPIPGWEPEVETRTGSDTSLSASAPLPLLCPAAHHFVSSTFGNQERMITKEGAPTLRIHPADAAVRDIQSGQLVRVSNQRGWCRLVAEVTDMVRPGVLATTTVWWPKFSPDQRNVNWTTPDRLADLGGGSTFYTNLVTVEPAELDK